MKKISLIVPIYGVENYIERCLISIFEQTYQNFELIFVNDCTKDESYKILLEVIDRYQYLNIDIKIITHEKNSGISAVRETGLNAASGEYILYIDSDDYIASDMLETLIDRAITHDADIVYCDYYIVKQGNKLYQSQLLPTDSTLEMTASMLRGEIRWCPWNKLFKRSLAIDNKIHWPVGVNLGEDLAVLPILFYFAKKIEHVPQALYFYNRDNENSYLNTWKIASFHQNIQAIEILVAFFKRRPESALLIPSLDQTKLMMRYLMLYTLNFNLVDLMGQTFPETDSKVLSYKHASIFWRLIMYLEVNGMSLISRAALMLIRHIKNFRTAISTANVISIK